MFAAPQVGRTYREEASWNNAEDLSEVLSVTATEHSPAATCAGNCLLTRAFSPLDPGVSERKFYAPGVGQIVGTKDGESGRLELVEFTHN